MRFIILLLFFGCFAMPVFGQVPQWTNFINDHIIYDIALEGDYLWVGSQGGLTKINRVNGEKQTFLPSNSGLRGFGVRSIYIASDGVKWIGGESGGLMRFDGTDWEQFNYLNTGDTLIQISAIKAAPNGDLWLRSTINNYCGGCSRFIKYDGSGFTRMDEFFGFFNPTNGSGPVRDFDIAPNGDVWVLTGNDVQQFDGTNVVEIYALSDFGLANFEYAERLVMGADGRPLVVSAKNNKSKIWQLTNGQWSVMPINGNDSTEGVIRYIDTDAAGNLWLYAQTTTAGVPDLYYRFDGSTWQVWSSADLQNMPSASPGSEPHLIHVDSEGHWWFNYYTLGGIHTPKVYEFDGANWTGFDTEIFPLGGNYLRDVTLDCEGNIWFGGNSITRFDGSDWADFDIGANNINYDIWSITLDSTTCDLWISFHDGSTNNIGFCKFNGTIFTHFTTPSGGDVFKVLIGPTGDIWVASSSDGLGHYDGNGWTWLNPSNSPLSNFVYDIAFDHQDRLWVSSLNKGVSVFDNGNWTTFNPINSPLQNNVLWLFVDHFGTVWAWNGGSPLKFDGMEWTSFPVNAGAGYDHIYSMAEDLNGKLWFGSYYAVYEFNGNDLIAHKIENSNIGANLTFNIKIDPYNNKWFIHNPGVSVYNENGITNLPVNPPNSTTSSNPVAGVQSTILVYPNPSNGSFLVESSGNAPWTARVSDLSGRVVRTLVSNGEKTAVEGLSAGLYFLTIHQDRHIFNSKIMVGK
jgi:ligand-binding sensor domain-containing protein